jgi:lipopolysaccharide export system protein LptA
MTPNKKLLPTGFMFFLLCATALAQQPDGISLDADSVSLGLRGTGNVFTGLTVTDGSVTINAAEGKSTGDNGDLWELRGGLSVASDTVTLTAESGTIRVADGKFTAIELLGDPATLDGPVGDESRQLHLTAGRIAYDGMRRVLTVSEGAVFVSDGLEVRNCSWTYDLSDKSVQSRAEETSGKCQATVEMNRASAK